MKFSELNLEDSVLQALDAMNFQECTPVQEQTIPVILEGKDLIGVAQTGTGKTAAYLLPVINQLSKGGYPADAINCVIMSPTRELAQQIDQQMEGFCHLWRKRRSTFRTREERSDLRSRRCHRHSRAFNQPFKSGVCRPVEGFFLYPRRSRPYAGYGIC